VRGISKSTLLLKLLRRSALKFLRIIDQNDDFNFLMRKVFISNRFDGLSPVSMNGETLTKSLAQITKSKCVLEFGAGSSTLLFAQSAKEVFSVESDRQFASHVEEELRMCGLSSKAQILYANIGITKSYGQPVKFLKLFYKHRYRQYTNIFFDNSSFAFNPEIVFIDGRFRVWCALQSCARIQNDFLLIFDDYFSRSEYHVIESLLGPARRFSGDTAIFDVKKGHVKSNDLANLKSYQNDFR
jgi:hypothetical protein